MVQTTMSCQTSFKTKKSWEYQIEQDTYTLNMHKLNENIPQMVLG